MTRTPAKSYLRPRTWIFGVAATALLLILDFWLSWLRKSRSVASRTVLIVSMAVFFAVTVLSLYSLVRITSAMNVMINDAVVGIELTTSMRPLVGRLQLDMRIHGAAPVPVQQVEAVRTLFFSLLDRYAKRLPPGAVEREPRVIAEAARLYFNQARAIATAAYAPDDATLAKLDSTQRDLTTALAKALEMDLAIAHAAAEKSDSSARLALRLAIWLGSAACAAIAIVLGLSILPRWLGHEDLGPTA